MNTVEVERKSYEMPPRDGFTFGCKGEGQGRGGAAATGDCGRTGDPRRHLGLDRHTLGQGFLVRAIDDAAAAAWAVPGVTDVIDKLSVDRL